MKPLERMKLIKDIALHLQQTMTFDEIDMFLPHFGIDCNGIQPSVNSKRVYVQEVLSGVKTEIISEIAKELEIIEDSVSVKDEIITFWEKGHFKLFISHIVKHKIKASQLQQGLKIYGISSFVAHEDIEPSREWQVEIEKALYSMDGLVALLTEGFNESKWCDQEVGAAIGRDVLIIPIKKEINPYGFIGKFQAIQPKNKTVQQVSEEVFNVIVNHKKTRNKMLEIFTNLISISTHIDLSIKQIGILEKIENLPIELLEQMIKDINNNETLSTSKDFIEHFNIFLKKYDLIFNKTFDYDEEKIDEIPF